MKLTKICPKCQSSNIVRIDGYTGAYVLIAIANAAMIIFMHRENIKRLIAGKENKFSFKKSVKPKDQSKSEDDTAEK